ncbi:MAG: hypothetical protein RRY12_00005 [Cloacibacillus sp.]
MGLTIITLLTAGMASWGATGKIELRPKGYQLQNEAYVVPVADGRDTVEMIETQNAELGALRRHITVQDGIVDAISSDIVALEASVAAEREAWESGVEKLQKANKRLRSPWSLGIFGGYDAVGREFCIGAGITYSFLRF